MKKRMDKMGVDSDGFQSNWKKHWKSLDGKLKRHEFFEKDIKIKKKDKLGKDSMFFQQRGVANSSKSNQRKLRKAKIKELEQEDISSNQANEYLEVLQRIRDGIKTPKHKKIQKHLPDITINKKKVKRFLKRIKDLEIKQVIDIETGSELPSKDIVDKQYDELDSIYNEISLINNSEDIEDGKKTLFHLDLYTELLLSFGKIGRIHRMMSIYKELKVNNLPITNTTLITMLYMVSGNEILTKQLWNEYLNDFRKGKISERPTLELFNGLMYSFSNGTSYQLFDVAVIFRMMTEEFKIEPNSDTMSYLLLSYKQTSPPRYKSSQKLIKKMRTEYKLAPNINHYTIALSTICTKWNHFSKFYKELECVDNKYLNHFKGGIDIKRSMKVFHTILQNKDLEINSDLFSAILKGCNNSDIAPEKRLICAHNIFKKYILLDQDDDNDDIILNERFPEISKLIFKSDVCSELLKCCFFLRNYDKAKKYYNIFTMDDKLKNRFIVDCDLFCDLIDGISCDLRSHFVCQIDEYQEIAMERIKWIENEMNKYDILPNSKVWHHWLMIAKRLKLPDITEYLLSKMDDFICNISYFEFDINLLQSVIEALYNNNNMDKALEYYGKYYVDIKLFSHWDLKNTGQKEIDFHGFRTGFSCVALQWILQNEYPPINISKYLLEKYAGNKNPNIIIVIGQGHHNQFGESRLYKHLIKYIHTLYPKINASTYPNNVGQLVLNGDDIVKWRKYHQFQVDTLKVNDNLQMRLFI